VNICSIVSASSLEKYDTILAATSVHDVEIF
jgi:hypothetical protein